MTATAHSCAVCGASPSKASGIVRATVEARTVFLCRAHAAIVVVARPATFEELSRDVIPDEAGGAGDENHFLNESIVNFRPVAKSVGAGSDAMLRKRDPSMTLRICSPALAGPYRAFAGNPISR